MFHITNHQGNANKNHNDTSPPSHQDGYEEKKKKDKITSVGKDAEKLKPLCSVVCGAPAMGRSTEVLNTLKTELPCDAAILLLGMSANN